MKRKANTSTAEATETRSQPQANGEVVLTSPLEKEKPRISCVIRLRNLHPKQQQFADSLAKRIIIKAGRRGGKTTGMADIAATEFMAGHRVLYATPTADQIKRFWSEVTYIFAEPLNKKALYKNESEHIIEVPAQQTVDIEGKLKTFSKGVARIRAKTAWNADTLRGDYADVLILDEWQLMNEDAWEVVGAPMLIDNNGKAVFCYTPPSLRSRSTSKATDKLHARKMYKTAQADTSGKWATFHFTSYDNPHLSAEGLAEVTQDMTQLAVRQEIMGEELDEVPGALWTRKLIEGLRVKTAPEMSRIVVGIDPSGGSTNEAGVVAAGLGRDGHAYVMRDASLLATTPKTWATAAVGLYYELRADRVLGERNYGGDMVKTIVLGVDEMVSYKDVVATRGKAVRAEPIAALYERGLVHHVGDFTLLEDEMCTYVPGDAHSPNRMDALVWCIAEIMPIGQSLGLIGYLQAGAPGGAAEEKQLARGGAAAARPTEQQPAAEEKKADVMRCPSCNADSIGRVAGGQLRCQQCGVQWWGNGSRPPSTQSQGRNSMTEGGMLR